MRKKLLVEIAVKLGGIYFFIESIFPLIRFLTYLINETGNQEQFGYLVWSFGIDMFVLISLAFFMIFWSDSIVNVLFRNNDEDEIIEINQTKYDLVQIAMIIIGVLLIINSISHLIPLFFEYIYRQNANRDAFFDADYSINPYVHILKFLGGLFLLLKSSSISDWIFRKETVEEIE